MAEIITFTNQKGGVGKTSLALNFGIRLKLAGAKVLFVDMDPQCNLTYIMGIDEAPVTVYDLLTGQSDVREAILHTGEADLIAASPALSTLNLSLNGPGREYLLRNALQPIVSEYNFIVIDSPPTLGILTINILTAADSVIIPVQCEYFALEGISKLLNTIKIIKSKLNPKLEIEGFLLTMYDSRLRLANQIYDEVKRHFQELVFKTVIQRNVKLSESPSHGLPVILYDAESNGAKNHLALAKEIINKNR